MAGMERIIESSLGRHSAQSRQPAEKMRMQMLKESSFHTGTVEINFAEGPHSGPPLVLLHGLPGRWQEFLPILPTLSLLWHTYALDYRGQGKSGRVPGQYHSKYYAADVEEFLRQQLDEPAILFGVSAGGNVALAVAAKCPELVRAIIVGDSPIDMDMLVAWMTSEGFKRLFSALRELAGMNLSVAELTRQIADIPIRVPGQDTPIRYRERPDIDAIQIQQLALTLSHMDPGVLEYHAEGRASEFLEGFDLDQMLARITSPVLLLQGNPSLGGMMTNDAVKHVQSILPNAMHVLIESAGHGLGLDTWEVSPLIRAVTSFLESV
jgi:pimeloyl-ACP methyl ester carboxylesterase